MIEIGFFSQCVGARRADWLAKTEKLLRSEVIYFQVVFTLPDRQFAIDETKVTDLTAIKKLTNLHVLSVDHTKIDDLKPLHGLKQLTTLYAHRIAAPESEFNALRKALPNLKVNP